MNSNYALFVLQMHKDGELVAFENGYPHLEGGGDMTIAFPKFNQYAAFDALFKPSNTPETLPEPGLCPTQPEPRPEPNNAANGLDINVNVKS